MYYIYMIRCEDASIYTGITTSFTRRFAEHCGAGGKGARYTRSHRPLALLALWQCEGRAEASRLEYRIKRLPKARKEQLALSGDLTILEGLPQPERYQKAVWEGV